MAKKATLWLAGLLLAPVLLFLLLAALLYVPPVQNWAVQRVAAMASARTGMDISVGHVALKFPLDLSLDDFIAVHQGDTLANVGNLVADVRLRPLLRGVVAVDQLELNQASLNTNGFISDVRVQGRFGQLAVSSRGIDLKQKSVELNGATLTDADLDISLSDTAATDTTTSVLPWVVHADEISLHNSRLLLHMPGDTLRIGAVLGSATAREGLFNLYTGVYSLQSLDWTDGQLSYDQTQAPTAQGLDYNHISLSDISLGIDSIYYHAPNTTLSIRHASMKERSGLQLTHLSGVVLLDSARVRLPNLRLKTTDSDLAAEADVDFNVMDSVAPGRMRLRLNAQLGKQDLLRFAGALPQDFVRRYPNQPLAVKGSVNGNMQRLEFTGLDVKLPTAFHLAASGVATNLTEPERLKARVSLKAESQELGFVTALPQLSALSPQLALPRGMALQGDVQADGPHYAADMTARQGQGTVRLKGSYNRLTENYDADVAVSNLNLHAFLPHDSIYTLSATAKASGHGTDFLQKSSWAKADATVSQLHYGHWNLDNIGLKATLKNGVAQAAIDGQNELFDGSVSLNGLVSTSRIDATLSADLRKADLFRMRLVDDQLTIGLCGHIDLATDLKQSHRLNGQLGELYIKDAKATYYPEDVSLSLLTDCDTTCARLQSGDLALRLDASGGYERLLGQFATLGDTLRSQYEHKVIDQPLIKQLLPTMRLYLSSGRNNPVANILRSKDIDFRNLLADVTLSPEEGINGQAFLHSLVYDSIRIDTVTLNLKQKGDMLTYNGQVRNNKRNPQFVFNALFDGHFHQHGALMGVRYYDDKNRMGVRLGATAEMEQAGIRFRLMPERPTIGYKEFRLNKDNYLLLGNDNRLLAKVDLVADDGTGVKIYSNDPVAGSDSTELQATRYRQDLTVSLNQFNLDELTSVLPYMPRLTGLLDGDFHIVQDQQEQFSVVSDLSVRQMTYEGSPLGNLSTELVYLQREDDAHVLEARLMLDDEEFGLLSGSIKDSIDATFVMTRLPLSLANGFVPDQLMGLDGYAEGTLDIKGTASRPRVNGEVYLDSAYLVSQPYGVRMRFDNDPVRIVNSRLLLENFGLYAYNDEPLNLMGQIDFSNLERVTMDIRMMARNLQLIDARQNARSVAFGKAFVNLFATLDGPLEALKMRGKLDVLGSTDMTYMLLDSPLSTDNRLDELVKFTDFSDTTLTVVTRPTPSGLDADLNISISQGAHIKCDLNVEQTNYVDLMGGGDLRMKYNAEGISLTGRYTLSNGEMKYSLPVIPLKTFTIQDGSYVEFTGDPMNPRLNITATERTKATVGDDMGGASRSVAFDCGVVITKTLNDMGLQFTISAPEDMSVNSELQAMSAEERGKLAVTMLTTGMYLADGNTNGFSMNSALSSFLEGEINNITGSALKTLDLSFGMDNTTDATGTMHTDYSFKFAKRFWNNRLKLQLGGKVSTGADDLSGQQQSFFDNVTMEYRLDQSGQKNVKVFYNQNVYDWLDGYTGEYGVGFVWRRKLDSLKDIFRGSQPAMLPQPRTPSSTDKDKAPGTQAPPAQ